MSKKHKHQTIAPVISYRRADIPGPVPIAPAPRRATEPDWLDPSTPTGHLIADGKKMPFWMPPSTGLTG